ncbi:MAG: DUF4147 domain-containing protein [Alphaproteobacteria bacterium]|nr:DUF4147 domain-containing protein [Alphaproteobacteria bacterium]
MQDPAAFLRRLFDRAVAVADPMQSLAQYLPPRPKGRLLVIGAGKASARMAEAVEAVYGPCEGLVITRYGYSRPSHGIEIVEAAHPVPDKSGLEATMRLRALVSNLTENDTVLALISGGASSLLVQPAGTMTLTEKQQINDLLLASGATISVSLTASSPFVLPSASTSSPRAIRRSPTKSSTGSSTLRSSGRTPPGPTARRSRTRGRARPTATTTSTGTWVKGLSLPL